ncbi:Solute carrier family 15 member 1 [Smittium culicis]|uniref:Solute carrier family 15 member 1 n=1 Tax=Smittium culicis TaxID=133412 RepID=A0A1R1XYR1_9FUNG|nr:Solute carrier family 15 member 1 [Smittium culicis]
MNKYEKGLVVEDNSPDEFGYYRTRPDDFKVGIPDTLNMRILLPIVFELLKSISYFGIVYFFTTYIWMDIGMDRKFIARIKTGLNFFYYFAILLGAVLSDQYFGNFKMIFFSSCLTVVGMILIGISTLETIKDSVKVPLFIVSMFLLFGIGSSFINPSIIAFSGNQVRKGYKPTKTDGVYIDSRATVERCYRYIYSASIVGGIVGTYIAPRIKNYDSPIINPLSSLAIMFVGIAAFISGYKIYYRNPITESSISKAYRCIKYALNNKKSSNSNWLDSSKSSKGGNYDDEFVDGLKRIKSMTT